jgi:hypothetical protein
MRKHNRLALIRVGLSIVTSGPRVCFFESEVVPLSSHALWGLGGAPGLLCQIRQRIGSSESPKRFHALALSVVSSIGVGEYSSGSSDKFVGWRFRVPRLWMQAYLLRTSQAIGCVCLHGKKSKD